MLCCDLRLEPADTKAFTYEALLPVRAPPSYKGENIAYFHKLAIGVQRVGNPAELLRIPLRVLPIDPQLMMACRRESAIHAARSAGRLESAIGRPSLSEDSIEFVSAMSMEEYISRSEGFIAHIPNPLGRTSFLDNPQGHERRGHPEYCAIDAVVARSCVRTPSGLATVTGTPF